MWYVIFIIIEFEICVYGTCPKTVVESLMVEHSKLHHKGHKACDNKQSSPLHFIYPLAILHLHLFRHNYYKWSLILVMVPPPLNNAILFYVQLGCITYTSHESYVEVVCIHSNVGVDL